MLELLIAELEKLENPFFAGVKNPSSFDLGYVAGLKRAIEILEKAK